MKVTSRIFSLVFATFCLVQATLAQTTSFTYQGKLTDGASPANGSYDLQFALFDSLSGGSQIGSTLTLASTTVTGGIFTVQLDFGNAFPGANRFLETSVRPAGGGAFTLLTPRQRITSTPYAIRSASASNADNAVQLNGVAAGQYVLTTDARMTDSRSPAPGSSNYIQNLTSQQSNTNFNISGNGVVNGRIGVGTNNPVSKLDVRGNTTIGLTSFSPIFGVNALFLANDDGGNPNNYFRIDGSNDTLYIVASAQSPAATGPGITFRTGGGSDIEVDRLRINPTGLIQAYSSLEVNGHITSPFGIGVGTLTPQRALHIIGRVRFQDVPLETSIFSICSNGFGDLVQCGASSLRLKKNVTSFHGGLDIVRRLKPISFDWKDGSGHDIGLGAEDVANVAPSLTLNNNEGEVAGVKYERLNVLLINAIKEQQIQIEKLQRRLASLEKKQRTKGARR
jgi:hypothetical protein